MTEQGTVTTLKLSSVVRRPIVFLATGFGSGLSPWAPGTAGTVVAIPIYLLIYGAIYAIIEQAATQNLLENTAAGFLCLYLAIVFVISVLGIYICDQAANFMGVHDHPSIVWDEIAGFLITMIAVPLDWVWIVVGFLLFRFFDILKPWPISLLDRHVKGGFGIMIDDVLAGLFACVLLNGLVYLFQV